MRRSIVQVGVTGFLMIAAACAHGRPADSAPDAGAGAPVPSVGMPQASDEVIPPPRANTLGVSDVFEVRVFEEPSLSGIFRVDSDGTVDYPLCGRVHLSGLEASAASSVITECLKDGYLRDPQVSIFVKEYNSKKVFVFGEVTKPGTFTYEDGMSVVEAVTRAGGFSKLAAKNSVIITRTVNGREQKLKVPVEDIGVGRAPNFDLEPGDIIFVPESFF